MKLVKFPLVPFSIFFAIGIAAEYSVHFSGLSLVLSFLGLLLILLLLSRKTNKELTQNPFFGIVTYLLALFLGMLTFFVHADENESNYYGKHHFEELNSIRAIVTTSLKTNFKYNKYFIEIQTFNDTIASGKMLLYVSKSNKKLSAGEEIYLNAAIYPIPKAFNPYQFDYAKYLEKQDIKHQIYAAKNQLISVQIHKNVDYFMENLRNILSSSFEIHHFDATTKAIIDALLLGQRVTLDQETIADYSNAGVIHILAISGLHISILYVFILFLLKPLRKIRFGKELELVLILLFLWFFALLTGLPASVVRAVTLFSFISIGVYFNQSKSIYNAIAVSALLLLLFAPKMLFDIGFQLSYAAVIAIVLFQPFYKKIYFTENKIVRYFLDTISVSLAAQLGVLPLTLYYFNQFPLLFLAANLVIIPLSTVILVGGLMVLFFNFTIPMVALFLGKCLNFCVEIMNVYIHWIAAFENAVITSISFSGLLVAFLYVCIGFFTYWMYHRTAQNFKYIAISLFVFQLIYLGTKLSENTSDEFLVLNTKSDAIIIKEKQVLQAFTNHFEANKEAISNYKRGTFTDSLGVFPMQNVYFQSGKKILVVDSLGIYKTSIPPDIVILTENPKINLKRLLATFRPNLIIATKNNYKNSVKLWQTTCNKEKIPFHAIAEKGYYLLK